MPERDDDRGSDDAFAPPDPLAVMRSAFDQGYGTRPAGSEEDNRHRFGRRRRQSGSTPTRAAERATREAEDNRRLGRRHVEEPPEPADEPVDEVVEEESTVEEAVEPRPAAERPGWAYSGPPAPEIKEQAPAEATPVETTPSINHEMFRPPEDPEQFASPEPTLPPVPAVTPDPDPVAVPEPIRVDELPPVPAPAPAYEPVQAAVAPAAVEPVATKPVPEPDESDHSEQDEPAKRGIFGRRKARKETPQLPEESMNEWLDHPAAPTADPVTDPAAPAPEQGDRDSYGVSGFSTGVVPPPPIQTSPADADSATARFDVAEVQAADVPEVPATAAATPEASAPARATGSRARRREPIDAPEYVAYRQASPMRTALMTGAVLAGLAACGGIAWALLSPGQRPLLLLMVACAFLLFFLLGLLFTKVGMLAVENGIIEVTKGKKSAHFDLNSPDLQIDPNDVPESRHWAVELTGGGKSMTVDRSQVDVEEFIDILEYYQAQAEAR